VAFFPTQAGCKPFPTVRAFSRVFIVVTALDRVVVCGRYFRWAAWTHFLSRRTSHWRERGDGGPSTMGFSGFHHVFDCISYSALVSTVVEGCFLSFPYKNLYLIQLPIFAPILSLHHLLHCTH
jgi:hypothetical protein